MTEVTLTQVLKAREDRAFMQKSFINKYKLPVICFTMNIAGPIKTSQAIERAFSDGIKKLESTIPNENILEKSISLHITGPCAVYAVNYDAYSLKDVCVSIEDNSVLGRLYDIDVIDVDGNKIERKNERHCIICGKQGKICAAGRLHSVETLQKTTNEIISGHFIEEDADTVGNLATECLLREVYTTPKPGLVDLRNNGSHKDMNIDIFEESAISLKPYFSECFKIGYEYSDKDFKSTFMALKNSGITAEKTMFSVTNNVNTHKGAIFSLGILCGSIGRLWSVAKPFSDLNTLLSVASSISAESFENIDISSNGGKLYHKHGIKGIRGEVLSGFLSVTNYSLPAYRKAISCGFDLNYAGCFALLHLIANVEDTNLYHRGGTSGLEFAKEATKTLLNSKQFPSVEEIEKLDDELIERNLSPGGCADLLAVTYFIDKILNN